jgi:hypothetical protein
MTAPRTKESGTRVPNTAAGRALYLSDWNPGVFGEGDEGDPFLLDILAIEAEAAAPYREALERLVEAEHPYSAADTKRQADAFAAARALLASGSDEPDALRREVGE